MPLETDSKFLGKPFPLYYLFGNIHQINLICSGEKLYGPSCLGSLSLKHFKNNMPLSFFRICFILLMYFCLSAGKKNMKTASIKDIVKVIVFELGI